MKKKKKEKKEEKKEDEIKWKQKSHALLCIPAVPTPQQDIQVI
jgi:hypothetical protein